MEKRFLELFKKYNYEIFPTERINLDYIEKEEYQDQDEDVEFLDSMVLEKNSNNNLRNLIDFPFSSTFFRYFLDGSRKVYKISDIAFGNKFLPIVCAQIGVACSERNDKLIKKYKLYNKNIILVPDIMSSLDIDKIKDDLESYSNHGIKIDYLERYEHKRGHNRKPLDLALAKVIQKMQSIEINQIIEMTNSNKLDTNKMLLIDGSLQFSDKRINEENFRNVLGISKSFNVHLTNILKKKNQEIGTILTRLRYGQRTPVYRIPISSNKNITIGAWYLRIRDENKMKNSLDGIIKVEKIANTKENEHIEGFESFVIDNISRNLLEERNVTCYGSDKRWPNHLYPIYLTERLIKDSFISDLYFMSVF